MRRPEVRTIVLMIEIKIESQNSERAKGKTRIKTTKIAIENFLTGINIP
jgi:hypothetical protein